MGKALVEEPTLAALLPTVFGFSDDFFEFVTGDMWTDLSADAGATIASTAIVGGGVLLTTGAVDNNEAVLHTTNIIGKIAVGKPLIAECRLQYAEAATDDANVGFGIMSSMGIDPLLDNGAGPKGNYSGAVIYKTDSDTTNGNVWKCETADGATKVNTILTAANSLDKTAKTAGGSAAAVLRITIETISSTQCEVVFTIDGITVAKHLATYANAANFSAFVAAKAGGANSETVTVDYIKFYQKR